MPFVGKLRKTLYALRGNHRYARFEELQKMQYLPYEQLQAIQLAALKKLIDHAYGTTAYYKKSFDALKITPKDIQSFEDYAQLPILTKKTMQDNIEDLCSSHTPKEKRLLNSSGGTTGNPARFYQDHNVFKEMDAHFLFILSMAGWTPDDMIFSLWGNVNDYLKPKKLSFIKPWLAGFQQCNAFRYGEEEMQHWVEAMKRHKKVFMYGYACALTDFANYCLKNNIILTNIAGIISTAEQLFPEYRETLEKAFTCKVFDQYGAREVQSIAAQCEHGNMHILTTSAYTEFLPLEEKGLDIHEHGTHADTKDIQRLILTSLNNYTMPLLRYEIGDFASPSESHNPCPCQRNSKTMHMNIGRIGGTLLSLKGEKLYSSLFVRKVCAIPGIENFQFRQKNLENIDLYIVKGKDFTHNSEESFKAFKQDFPINICPGTQVSIHYVDAIPRTEGGKHRQVVCEVNI